MSYRPNSQGGRRGRGGGGGGRGRGGGGRGEQRWWDPAWRAERLRQMEAEVVFSYFVFALICEFGRISTCIFNSGSEEKLSAEIFCLDSERMEISSF